MTQEGQKGLSLQANAGRPEARSDAPAIRYLKEVWQRFWRLFSSVRTAVVLILALTGLTLIGTLVIQVPADVAASPAEFAWWKANVAAEKVGFWAKPIGLLGLFDTFHSVWFLGVGALLVVNILVCSLNRWAGIMDAVTGTRVRLADGFYEGGSNRAEFVSQERSASDAATIVGLALKRRGYRVRQTTEGEGVYLAADRNRLFRLGTYISHLSIILFIVGFLLGSYLGFRERAFMVPEGSVRELGRGTNLSLQLQSFVDEYYPEGPPKDFRSEVVLYENGAEVKRGLIRVNHPLSYKGVRFYQSFFGQAAAMKVTDPSGAVLYDDGVAMGWTSGKKPYARPTGIFSLPGAGVTAYVVGPAQGYYDPLIKGGQMRVELYRSSDQRPQTPVAVGTLEQGEARNMGGYGVTFVREKQFSGFQVSKDPGNLIIWVSSGLFMVGLFAVLYFPHRQAWARVVTTAGGGSRALVRTVSARSFAVASDFEALAQELGSELASRKSPVEAKEV